MPKYTVTLTDSGREVARIHAYSPERVAKLAFRHVCREAALARRVTGERGQSGEWQGYRHVPDGLVEVGPRFRVEPVRPDAARRRRR